MSRGPGSPGEVDPTNPFDVDGAMDPGRFPLDELVSQVYPAADVQQAIDDLHDGKLNRGVLDFENA